MCTEGVDTDHPSGSNIDMVALRKSMGNLLTVEADSDLNLYASFILHDLFQNLGLTAEVHALTGDETLAEVINHQSYQTMGTVPVKAEAYTQQYFAFEDLFYVIRVSQESVGRNAPELVFGIDHVRQAMGLALNPGLFV